MVPPYWCSSSSMFARVASQVTMKWSVEVSLLMYRRDSSNRSNCWRWDWERSDERFYWGGKHPSRWLWAARVKWCTRTERDFCFRDRREREMDFERDATTSHALRVDRLLSPLFEYRNPRCHTDDWSDSAVDDTEKINEKNIQPVTDWLETNAYTYISKIFKRIIVGI